MGAVNEVVDHADLEKVALQWAAAINGKSPQAHRMLKFAFNLLDDGLVGQQVFAGEATRLAYMTDEAVEGRDAFLEKRDPDWSSVPPLLLSGGFTPRSAAVRDVPEVDGDPDSPRMRPAEQRQATSTDGRGMCRDARVVAAGIVEEPISTLWPARRNTEYCVVVACAGMSNAMVMPVSAPLRLNVAGRHRGFRRRYRSGRPHPRCDRFPGVA